MLIAASCCSQGKVIVLAFGVRVGPIGVELWIAAQHDAAHVGRSHGCEGEETMHPVAQKDDTLIKGEQAGHEARERGCD